MNRRVEVARGDHRYDQSPVVQRPELFIPAIVGLKCLWRKHSEQSVAPREALLDLFRPGLAAADSSGVLPDFEPRLFQVGFEAEGWLFSVFPGVGEEDAAGLRSGNQSVTSISLCWTGKRRRPPIPRHSVRGRRATNAPLRLRLPTSTVG